MISNLAQYMDFILKLANILIIGYGAYKFTKKPHDSLSERLTNLEDRVEKLDTEANIRQKDIEQQLRQGNDKFRFFGSVLEVLVTCVLALIDFEVHYCESEHKDISDDLANAKKALNKCLTKMDKEGTV